MAGLFSRLSQRVLAPEGNVQPAASNHGREFALPTDLPDEVGAVESFAPARPRAISGSTHARNPSGIGADARISKVILAHSMAPAIPEGIAPAQSTVIYSLPPRSLASEHLPATPEQPELERADLAPRLAGASRDTPAGPAREVGRTAQDLVARVSSDLLPSRRAAREPAIARAREPVTEAPVIHVSIDRIDVHQPPATAPAPPRASSKISLADYLSGARRRP